MIKEISACIWYSPCCVDDSVVSNMIRGEVWHKLYFSVDLSERITSHIIRVFHDNCGRCRVETISGVNKDAVIRGLRV